jgi:hypothetical protein
MNGQQPARRRNGGRLLAHIAVVIGVAAVAAAAFTLSYSAVRDIALAVGVPATLARLYPAIFDAVFVEACAAALTLREARWWARGYAWLSVLMTGALIAAAAAYHAMGLHLPHKIAAGIVAALPLALVVLGFSLWLSMLRYGRAGRAAAAADRPALAQGGPGQKPAIEAGPAVSGEPVAHVLPALPAPGLSLPAATGNAPSAEPASYSTPAPAPTPEPAPPTPEPAPACAAAREPEPEPAVEPVTAAEPKAAIDSEPAAQPEPVPAAEPAYAEPDSDALTPPYGFAAVGAPTFPSAPVPEPAEPEPAPAPAVKVGEAAPTTPQPPGAAAAARGNPPTTGTGLPAELAHEPAPATGEPDAVPHRTSGRAPGNGADRASGPSAAGEPAAPAVPAARFERVHSTPTPPGD